MKLQHALWWAQDYAWAGAAWVGTVFAPPTPDRYAEGAGRPVVVVPGVYEDWRFMRPVIVPVSQAGFPVHVVTELGHTRAPIADGARLVLALLAERDLRNVVIVAHSKGGLIGKLAMQADPESRIAAMVTICTPFRGSRLARLLPLPSLRSLVPTHSSLAGLADPGAVNARITSIYGPFDEHVPEGSELPGARNVQLDTAGHFQLLGDATCRAEVLRVVRTAPPAAPPPPAPEVPVGPGTGVG